MPEVFELSLDTPLGPITLAEAEGALVELNWGRAGNETETPLLRRARCQLQAYFDNGAKSFNLPLRPAGSAFQRRVWRAMCEIAAGQTRSYGALARNVGSGPRAVAGACARNPIGIIIPCHRVVAADGLGGFSAPGGVDTKRALLRLEGVAV